MWTTRYTATNIALLAGGGFLNGITLFFIGMSSDPFDWGVRHSYSEIVLHLYACLATITCLLYLLNLYSSKLAIVVIWPMTMICAALILVGAMSYFFTFSLLLVSGSLTSAMDRNSRRRAEEEAELP